MGTFRIETELPTGKILSKLDKKKHGLYVDPTLVTLKMERHMTYPVGEHIVDNLPFIDELSDILQKMLKRYKVSENTTVSLICTGSSGAIISAIIADKLKQKSKRHIIIKHLKKDGEKSHCDSFDINGYSFNVFVDDFICDGNTLKRVHTKMGVYKFDGILTYSRLDRFQVGYIFDDIFELLKSDGFITFWQR